MATILTSQIYQAPVCSTSVLVLQIVPANYRMHYNILHIIHTPSAMFFGDDFPMSENHPKYLPSASSVRYGKAEGHQSLR